MTGLDAERHGETLLLTLNRPDALNAINVEVREELNRQLHEIERMAGDCRVVVITGTGRAFCAGGDVAQMTEFFGEGPDVAVRHMLRFQEMVRLIWRLPIPVITAVNGLALGGGTAVALMSDLRVASEDAVFGVGQVSRGVVPDVGLTYILPRVMGLARALEMMILDRRLTAQEALELGVVNRVVAGDALMDTAMEMAEQIAAQSEPAVRWIKRVTYMNLDASFEQALNLEAMAEGILIETPEFKAGLEAFLARRGNSRHGA